MRLKMIQNDVFKQRNTLLWHLVSHTLFVKSLDRLGMLEMIILRSVCKGKILLSILMASVYVKYARGRYC